MVNGCNDEENQFDDGCSLAVVMVVILISGLERIFHNHQLYKQLLLRVC